MKGQSGLTLVELLIALAVIGIAMAALISSQILSFKVTRDAQKSSLAKDIASQQIEVIRGYGFGSYMNCPTTSPSSPAPACTGSQSVSNYAGYTLAWSITNAPKNPSNLTQTLNLTKPALVGVSVTVSWTGGSYVLSSYLSCADAGEFSFTTVPCPAESMR
jgi:prepilin-type N-terminal cleavage/methylation domain-containing protein